MAAYRILVLVALCAAHVTQAQDFTTSPSRSERQAYSGYPGANYGGNLYAGASRFAMSPYLYNSVYGYPYSGGGYGEAFPNSDYNYPYSANFGYNTGGGAYPYSTGYSGYPYQSGYYGSGGQYYN